MTDIASGGGKIFTVGGGTSNYGSSGKNKIVYQFTGSGFTPLATPFEAYGRLAVDGGGNAWVIATDGKIYYGSAAGWALLDPNHLPARDIDVSPDGSIWIISEDGRNIQQFTGDGGWQEVYHLGCDTNLFAVDIAIDNSTNPWFASESGQVYSW